MNKMASIQYASEGAAPDMRGAAWPAFWQEVRQKLRSSGYGHGTLHLYRSVLRGIARSSRQSPDRIGSAHIDFYLRRLAYARRSASWIGMNICVLRTVFDKCCGLTLLRDRRGPRRPRPLPQVLPVADVSKLLATAASPRDALLLSLLYGCGLKPGEAIALRWGAFDPDAGTLRIEERLLPLPTGLIPLVRAGLERCGPEAHVFAGRKAGRHLTLRAVSRIVRNAAAEANLHRPVSPMTLRNSYAQHQLQAGMNVRELQENLGHETLESTLRYCALEPPEATSPLDRIAGPDVAEIPAITVSDSAPPFPVEQPTRYFLNWLKSAARRVFHPFRSSA
ncbi:MAG: tyrosine-type recombinase/integrase [Kiritimatiellia bacterium]|nr:tyrosine-type recombinase/integrase [Kiritimatiellia bacterium]